jgi:hypothetical protein
MITEKWSQFIIIGLIIAVIVVGAAGFLRPTVISQLKEENRLSVSGAAILSVEPDEVVIVVGSETEAASAEDSQRANTGAINGIRSALNRTGIAAENVTTVAYYLEIIREYDKDEIPEVVGYRTIHLLEIKSASTKKAGEYVDAAVNGGANRVDSVTFGLSDANEKAVRTQALALAGQDARAKAEASAAGLGLSVKRVVRASEGWVYVTPMRAGAEAMSTEITPGQVQVSASLNVAYEIG